MEGRVFDVRFPVGATHLLVGVSASGKTFRCCRILELKDRLFVNGDQIKNVVFCYAAWQPRYQQLKDAGVVTKWVNRLPTNEEFIQLVGGARDQGGSIVVIDDFQTSIDKDLVEIVCVTSRHYNTSTFILFQSLFPPSPLARQISLNVKFLHIHKNPRENAQIQYLARQLRPQSYKWIVAAYHEATRRPHSCLLIDLTQACDDLVRFRSCYLPEEFPLQVWMEKGAASTII